MRPPKYFAALNRSIFTNLHLFLSLLLLVYKEAHAKHESQYRSSSITSPGPVASPPVATVTSPSAPSHAVIKGIVVDEYASSPIPKWKDVEREKERDMLYIQSQLPPPRYMVVCLTWIIFDVS